MVSVLQKAARLKANMCVGMAGVLDSARLKYFLADAKLFFLTFNQKVGIFSLKYDSLKPNETIDGSWESFFENQDNTNCPIQKCILKNGLNCENKYAGSVIKISNAAPFAVSAS